MIISWAKHLVRISFCLVGAKKIGLPVVFQDQEICDSRALEDQKENIVGEAEEGGNEDGNDDENDDEEEGEEDEDEEEEEDTAMDDEEDAKMEANVNAGVHKSKTIQSGVKLSDYEIQKANNIQENNELLKKLGLQNVKETLLDGKETATKKKKSGSTNVTKVKPMVSKPVLRSQR